MLKEYTLKVTVRVGGDDEAECEEHFAQWEDEVLSDTPHEITHEEVVCNDEVERE